MYGRTDARWDIRSGTSGEHGAESRSCWLRVITTGDQLAVFDLEAATRLIAAAVPLRERAVPVLQGLLADGRFADALREAIVAALGAIDGPSAANELMDLALTGDHSAAIHDAIASLRNRNAANELLGAPDKLRLSEEPLVIDDEARSDVWTSERLGAFTFAVTRALTSMGHGSDLVSPESYVNARGPVSRLASVLFADSSPSPERCTR